jgi:hypothetical protein
VSPIASPVEIERRRRRLAPAKRALVVEELRQVKRLLQVTPPNDKDHPRLLRRLAATHRQLRELATHEALRARRAAERAAQRDAPDEARRQRRLAHDASHMAATARDKTIAYYRRLLTEHPHYCRFPLARRPADRSCRDEVLFFMARELADGDRWDAATRRYHELIAHHPGSKYRSLAQIAVAELHLEASTASNRDHLAQARVSYQRAARSLGAKQLMGAYAYYRLGNVAWLEQRYGAAVSAFSSAIEGAMTIRPAAGAAPLLEAARRDLVNVYAIGGDARQAERLFRRLSGDAPGSHTKTLTMLEDLGRSLMNNAAFRPASTVFRQLLARASELDRCRHHHQLARASIALHPVDQPRIMALLRAQLDHHRQLRKAAPGSRPELACGEATAALLVDATSDWHVEAVGKTGAGGTGDGATLAAAERGYRMLLRHFGARELAHFAFGDFDSDMRPTLARIHLARGDVLERLARWPDCADAYRAAESTSQDPAVATQGRIGVAYCYERVHHDEATRGTVLEDPQMLAAFDRYLCSVAADPADADQQARRARIELAHAERLLAGGEHEATIAAFGRLPFAKLERAPAERAARLLLAAVDGASTSTDCLGTRNEQLASATRTLCRPNPERLPDTQPRAETGHEPRADAQVCRRLEAHGRRLRRRLRTPVRNAKNGSDPPLELAPGG